MQLPKLRMPNFSFGGVLAGSRSLILYGLYTVVLFLGFLVVTFPHDLLLRRALTAVGLGAGEAPIDFSDVAFAGWRGYRIDGLRVLPPAGQDGSFFELTHLWVRPTLGELVSGNPYSFNLQAELYGGSAVGRVAYKAGSLTGDVAWEGLSLGRYRPLVAMLDEGELAGRVSGLLSFETPLRNTAAAQAAGDITLDAATITSGKVAGFTVGNLGVKQAKLKLKAGQGRIEVQDLNVSGDINVQQTSGQLGIREPIGESTVNLRTNILQTPTTPDWLKTLISAIPRPAGAKLDAPVNVTGTIAKPRFR